MSLASLLRELCDRGILEKKRDTDSPTDFYFVTLPCGAGVSYTIARLCVEHPDAPLFDMIVRGVSLEIRGFLTEHKIALDQAQFEAWVDAVSTVGWRTNQKRTLVGSVTCFGAWRSKDAIEELLTPALASRLHSQHIKKFLGIVLHPRNGEWPQPLPDLANLPDAVVDEIVKKTFQFYQAQIE